MRIKLNLKAGNNTSIPIEYNYNVYSSIKKILFEYLQDHKPKYLSKFERDFPSFTFSQLMIPERRIEPGFIKIKGNFLSIFITSVDEIFMEYLVKAVNTKNEFPLFEHHFPLKKLEILDPPNFEEEMRFKMLSPLLLIKVKNKKPSFVRPEDTDLSDVFAAHLAGSYNGLNETNYRGSDVKFIPDQDYLERKRSLTKAITVRNVHYKTIFCPFALIGEPKLIQFAYENGIGANTHYGFGMIEVV
jgi:CRISPR-associated endoribonuclease Cas6